MKFGLIARADDRGLSHITWELARNLTPSRVLLVDMGDPRFPTYHDRYDGLTDLVLVWSYQHGDKSVDALRPFFDGLDVVFTAETFYGLDAALAHVPTINYLMPEFYRADVPRPTETWLPTTWLSDFVEHDRIIPLPCPLDRWYNQQTEYRKNGERLRVVHPAGNSAKEDRNGTKLFMAALRYVTEEVDVTVWTQDRAFPIESRMSKTVNYTLSRRAENYWEIARNAHLVVIPRRYGGLCLPAIEALGSGAVLGMTDCNPNTIWPIEPISCRPGVSVPCPFGLAPAWDAEPRDIAHLIDYLASDAKLTRARQEESREWAFEHSWRNSRDAWRAALEQVAKS